VAPLMVGMSPSSTLLYKRTAIILVDSLTRFVAVVWHTSHAQAVGWYVTSLMAKQGLRRLACTFGSGDFGRLVHGNNAPELLPRIVAQLADTDVKQAAAGGAHTVIVTGKPACRLQTCSNGNGLTSSRQ
jgi:Regulator of chromosome condensation (RCC1) repeat